MEVDDSGPCALRVASPDEDDFVRSVSGALRLHAESVSGRWLTGAAGFATKR